MSPVAVPEILMDRLSERGASALVDLLLASRRACADDVLEKTAERFERCLVEETSQLRVDMARLQTDLHGEIVSSRFELIKWNFVFWIGQVVALAGVISLMLRSR